MREGEEDFKNLYKKADSALYLAKKEKGRLIFSNKSIAGGTILYGAGTDSADFQIMQSIIEKESICAPELRGVLYYQSVSQWLRFMKRQ